MSSRIELLPGESPIPNAPFIKLHQGRQCIPQHYLQFNHTQSSVEQVVLDIHYDDKYPVFVCTESGGIYIQVGIIGFDNYQFTPLQPKKIVYGRKWRVEAQLPTSEIIQTVFLALQKAREHEVRELLRLSEDNRTTTPFSNHHDLPLMAQLSACLSHQVEKVEEDEQHVWLQKQLNKLKYDDAHIQLTQLQHRSNGQWLVDLEVLPGPQTNLPELNNRHLTLLLDELDFNELLFRLVDAFLMLSLRHVEENFTYKGFARFSRKNSISAIGQLSALTRHQKSISTSSEFVNSLVSANYMTDKSRVPNLGKGALGHKIRKQLKANNIAEGLLPDGID